MSVQPVVQYASRTDVGMRRSANQDALVVRLCSDYDEWVRAGHLFVVADGMGGHSVGDLASCITVESLPLAFAKSNSDSPSERLAMAIDAANRAINDKARENPEFADMGTTCSALSLSAKGALIGHVGDSRVYRVRRGVIEQLTFDHSLQWEMVRQGRATAENSELLHPRNVITRCLGPDKNVEIDIEGPFDVQRGDRFLLCSDGLTGHVGDNEIGAIVENLLPAEASRFLVDLANCRGGSDNTTVVIAAVDEYPQILSPTLESRSAELTQTQPSGIPKIDMAAAARRTVWGRMAMAVFGLVAVTGLILMMLQRQSLGLTLVGLALLLGFARLILSARKSTGVEVEQAAENLGDSLAPLGAREPAPTSPYRREDAQLRPEFLDLLAEAQSELTAAAHDNGWELDVATLSQLSAKAAARKESQGGLEEYAKAMRILMKQFTAHLRSRVQ
jgi:serine/threonine protein phosphatase PrpC